MQSRKLLEQIFSDAHVVDVDLSGWDRAIELYVLADHMPHTEPNRLPLMRIRFVGVSSFQLQIDESAVGEVVMDDEHVQWRIDDLRLQQGDRTTTIDLWGSESSPKLRITFRDTEIEPVSPTTFDELFPSWTQPGRGLARPGPLEMLEQRHGENRARY